VASKAGFGKARLWWLRKNSGLPQLLGGAALQRCGKAFVLSPASAAEAMLTTEFFRNLFSRAANRSHKRWALASEVSDPFQKTSF
jgi:hypothetical protein